MGYIYFFKLTLFTKTFDSLHNAIPTNNPIAVLNLKSFFIFLILKDNLASETTEMKRINF